MDKKTTQQTTPPEPLHLEWACTCSVCTSQDDALPFDEPPIALLTADEIAGVLAPAGGAGSEGE